MLFLETNFIKQNLKAEIIYQEDKFENIFAKSTTILLRTQYINSLWHNDAI